MKRDDKNAIAHGVYNLQPFCANVIFGLIDPALRRSLESQKPLSGSFRPERQLSALDFINPEYSPKAITPALI